MKKILCIMGKSACGKSTLINKLCKLDEKFNNIKSFTTREVRKNDFENDMNTHTFVSFSKYENDLKQNKILALYENKEKKYYSWSTDELFEAYKINLYAIDPISFISFFNKFKNKYIIYGIYINVSEDLRKKRMLKRNSYLRNFNIENHLSIDNLKSNDEIKDFYSVFEDDDKNDISEYVLKLIGDLFE